MITTRAPRISISWIRPHLLGTVGVLALGCSVDSDEPGDPEDGSFSGSKADGFCAEEGSPQAAGILALVNDPATSVDELDRPTSDGGAGLDRRAAQNIVEERPFATLAELDLVPFVGVNTCGALLRHACDVQGRCDVAACEPDRFEPRPSRTAYDSGCEDVLLALLAARPTGTEEVLVTDATLRCEELPTTERRAFDWVAAEFDTPAAEFSDTFGEFSVIRVGVDGQNGVGLVHVIEQDSFTPFHVVLEDNALAAIWTTDGLSAGVDWFCGGHGEPAEAPDEFCLGALTDDAALCDPTAVDHVDVTRTVAEARTDTQDLVNAAIVEHAGEHQLADDASVEADVAACPPSAAVVKVASDGVATQTYRVVDSTRGLGVTVLTRTDGDGATRFVCANPE